MKTYAPRALDIERRWYVIDADGAVLGRLASEVAKLLRGKHKPIFAPHADTGDHVIVINARGVRLSGSKLEGKLYQHHSGYPGRTEDGLVRPPHGRAPHHGRREGRARHAAEEPAGPEDDRQAVGLRGRRAPARRPVAGPARPRGDSGLDRAPGAAGAQARSGAEGRAPAEVGSPVGTSPVDGRCQGAAGAKRSTRAPRAKAADAPKSGSTRRTSTASRGKKEAPAAAAKKEPGGTAKSKTTATRSRAKATKDDKES